MKALRQLEVIAWLGGCALLASYGGARWWYAYSHAAALAAFDTARETERAAPHTQDATHAPRPEEAVDMSTWSPQRIERYRASLRDVRTPEAVLRIPSLALVVPIFAGTGEWNLNRGAGLIEGTARIGAPGNVGIAAHRDGFFRVLKDVRVGDVVRLERIATTEEYRVIATRIVDPSNVEVLDPTPERSLTLVTCYPFYHAGPAPHRFIVRAQLVAPARDELAAPRDLNGGRGATR